MGSKTKDQSLTKLPPKQEGQKAAPEDLPLPLFSEEKLAYFEQAKLLNRQPHLPKNTHEQQLTRQRGRDLLGEMKKLGSYLLAALAPIRSDLSLYIQPMHGGRLPERFLLTIQRERIEEHEDAQLYVLLRGEGAEVGFGFFPLNKNKGSQEEKEKFFKQLGRFHRKSNRYLQALLRNDYRLWNTSQHSFSQASLSIEEWLAREGVIVKLLPNEILGTSQTAIAGLIGQLFGELVGLYGFMDRVYTEIPHIRPLHVVIPEESTTYPEDDFHILRSAASECLVDFSVYLRSQSFTFSPSLLRAYYLALQTRPFVILSGVSGTGKSKLAQLFAHFITEEGQESQEESPQKGNPHIAFVPVRPDWLDAQGLLGYYDTLAGTYRTTPFLRLLLRAAADPEQPYFVILDELNLSRVEYYFSDFLSILESRHYNRSGELIRQAPLHLHSEAGNIPVEDPWAGVLHLPPDFLIPPNVYITGTLNLDETTHRLSPKVLDRANVIEMQSPNPATFLEQLYRPPLLTVQRSPATVARQRSAFVRRGRFTAPYTSETLTLPPETLAHLAATLDTLFAVLKDAGFTFGVRIVQEILDFTENFHLLGTNKSNHDHPPLEWVLDRQILQKILPRLHGPRQRMEPLLQKCLLFCWPERKEPVYRQKLRKQSSEVLFQQSHTIEQYRLRALGSEDPQLSPPDLVESAEKIAKMLTELQYESYIDFYTHL